MRKLANKAIWVTVILALVFTLVGCTSKDSDKVIVASKEFTEQEILAYIVGLMLQRNTDLDVEIKTYLGGTDIIFSALKSGDIHIYSEYTGTALASILKQDLVNDPEEAYRIVKEGLLKEYQLEMLGEFGFNNTYVMAVREETAEQYSLKKISDLSSIADSLTLGTTVEFTERSDGLKGIEQLYGIKFNDVKVMNVGLRYIALDEKKIDITDAFSTDGLLVKYNLTFLEDDKHLFPPYYAAPVVRSDILKKHPEIRKILNKLVGRLDETTMMGLNAQVDVEKKNAKDVAESWLRQEGLIQ